MSSSGTHASPAVITAPGWSVTELRAELATARGDLAYGAPCAVYHVTGALGSGKSWLADQAIDDAVTPWVSARASGRADAHLAHAMAAALARGLVSASEGRPGLQSLHDARASAEELLRQPGSDETFAALGPIYERAGRALSEVAGLGMTIVIDDIDLSPGWSRPALGDCLDDLAALRMPVLLILLRHGTGAWATPEGLVVTTEIAPLSTTDIANLIPRELAREEAAQIQQWSQGRFLDVMTLATVIDDGHGSTIAEQLTIADQWLLDELTQRWSDLDGTAWRYLEAVVRLGGDATHDAVRRMLGDSNRFGTGPSLVSQAGRSLIEHRALSLSTHNQLVLGHRLLHQQVTGRS